MKISFLFCFSLSFALSLAVTGCPKGSDKGTEQGPIRQTAMPRTEAPPVFSGNRAFTYLTDQTALGPRNPNSRGHDACLRYLTETLRGRLAALRKETGDTYEYVPSRTPRMSFVMDPPTAPRPWKPADR